MLRNLTLRVDWQLLKATLGMLCAPSSLGGISSVAPTLGGFFDILLLVIHEDPFHRVDAYLGSLATCLIDLAADGGGVHIDVYASM